jgi:hypothetical protein
LVNKYNQNKTIFKILEKFNEIEKELSEVEKEVTIKVKSNGELNNDYIYFLLMTLYQRMPEFTY